MIVIAQGYGKSPFAYALAEMAQRAFMVTAANVAIGTPFTIAWLGRMLAVSNTTRTLVANENTTLLNGFSLFLSAAEKPQFRINNSVPAAVSLTSATTLAASTSIVGILCTYDGTTLKMSANKGTFDTNTPGTGGFTQTTNRQFAVGNNSTGGGAGTEPTDTDCLGVAYSNAVQTQGQSDAWFDACKTAVDVAALSAGTCTFWSVKQKMSNLVAAPIWAPSQGSLFDLTLQGTAYTRRPSITQIVSPAWSW